MTNQFKNIIAAIYVVNYVVDVCAVQSDDGTNLGPGQPQPFTGALSGEDELKVSSAVLPVAVPPAGAVQSPTEADLDMKLKTRCYKYMGLQNKKKKRFSSYL